MGHPEVGTTALLCITNLRARTIIGVNEWERECEQEIIVNVRAEFDAHDAVASDDIERTVNYRSMKKKILDELSASGCNLLETLVHRILLVVLADRRVACASVRVDKPGALRFAESVSIEMSGKR